MSLRVKVLSGARWLSGSTAIAAGLNFLQTIILSRLLDPREFGLAAMVWVFLGFAQMFADTGMSVATVQRHEVTSAQLSSVHWSNVIMASFMALLCWLCAPFWVSYYQEPALAPLVPWAAATLLTSAFGQQFHAMAQRELQFHRLAIGDTIAAIVSFLTATISAWFGMGALAILLAGLLSSTAKTLWLTVSGWGQWHPSLHLAGRDLDGFVRFGGFQIGDRISNYIWNNADYMLIGRLLGSEVLGYYRLAFEIVIRPLATIHPILNAISYPVFSRKQSDNAALQTGFLELIRLIAFTVTPMMFGLCAVAPFAVAAVFGPKWQPMVVLLQILSPMGLLRSLLNPTTQINIAKGMIGKVFCLNLTLACVLPLGFWISLRYGVVALCITELLLLASLMVATWMPLHHSTFGLSPQDYLKAVGKPVVLSTVMAACVYFLSWLLPLSWSPAYILSLLVSTGVIVYLTLLRTFDRPYCAYLIGLARGKV